MLKLDPGGGKGAMPPPFLLKLVIKKMAAICGALYFMFLAPPPRPSWIRRWQDIIGIHLLEQNVGKVPISMNISV